MAQKRQLSYAQHFSDLNCVYVAACFGHSLRDNRSQTAAKMWLWALNNLFFVCVAEECLFRGLIQGSLTNLVPNIFRWKWLPLVVSSSLFGLDHYEGGLPYILLAAFAGIFYGYAYWKTNKIKSSIFVHFGLNFTHFLFFSYPSMIAVH